MNASAPSSARRAFYTIAAALLLILTFAGFNRFYLHGTAYPGREIPPPIKTLVISHGVSMSAWLILLLIQPWLILKHRTRLHMTLGKIGSLLAITIFILGNLLAVQSARVTPAEVKVWNLPPKQFFAVPLIVAWGFAIFVAIGIYFRRRPEIHRAMIFSGTLLAMSAAVSRIDTLNNLYIGTVMEQIFGPFFMTLVLAWILLIVRCALERSFDRWLALGVAGVTMISLAIVQIAPTSAWEKFASAVVTP